MANKTMTLAASQVNKTMAVEFATDANGNVWYVANPWYAAYGGHNPMLRIRVMLTSGNVWDVAAYEDKGEGFELYSRYWDWEHVAGSAQKQPKEQVKKPIKVSIDDMVQNNGERFCASVDSLFKMLDAMLDDDGSALEEERKQSAAFAARVAQLEQENAELQQKSAAPSFDALVMQSLVSTLQPAIEQKAREMAEAVMKDGSLPTVLRVEVGNSVQQLSGIFHPRFADVVTMVANGMSVFLTGDAGTGKNVLAEQAANALGLDFVYMGQVMDKYTDCVGFMDANGNAHETPLIRAARDGGLLFVDEIDASIPEALITINALLANGYMVTGWGEHVTAHEDFRVICAGNTVGTGADSVYTGRYQLDGATLDRFALVPIDYDRRVELGIAGAGNEDLVDFIEGVRATVRAVGIAFPVTYRATKAVAKLMGAGMDLDFVLKAALFKSLREDDQRVICRRMRSDVRGIESNRFFKAFAEFAN